MRRSAPDTWLPTYVERMTEADLEVVLDIEEASFTTPWPRETFLGELDNNLAHLFVARLTGEEWHGRIAGYCCTWVVVDELHITSFAVHPDFRRHHIGYQLLAAVLARAVELRCCSAVLEVRASNRAAQRLYSQFGFAPVAVRKRYYTDNQEDAIVMFLSDIAGQLPPQPEPSS